MMDKFTISTAPTRKAIRWEQEEITWPQFAARCSRFAESGETYADYMALPKSRQDALKDVGGYVGGPLEDGLRRRGHCVGRRLITLDMDNCAPGTTATWLSSLKAQGFRCLAYSTRKHNPDAPRLRAVFLADRGMTPDEYQATARALAQMIDPLMRVFDPTTFEAERLMYWPSASRDAARVFWEDSDADPVPVDDILISTYADWTDCTSWPTCEQEERVRRSNADKQQDPRTKAGIVGAFCRVYDVPGAIDKFLPDIYKECGGNRYTYVAGSTTGGAVIYDDGAFLYSHHSTDPAGGRLLNAWDLTRVHRYGGLDAEAAPGTPTNRLPSFTAMCRLAESDQAVGELLAAERLDEATQGFATADDEKAEDDPTAPPSATDEDWMDKLARDRNGKLLSSVQNLRLIMEHDPLIRGRFWVDRFARRLKCKGPFPWPGPAGERGWSDTDDAGMRWYLETAYHVSGVNKVVDAVNLTAERHARDPVAEYLTALVWDQKPRIDRLFIDYLGAEDTEYVRSATRKMLVAAAARVLRPGCKFDQVMVLSGPQGIGKSTILQRLGRDWFTDSINSFAGKDAREAIQGVWIVELGELTALDKSEVEAVKQFVSQREDWFRAAYGRRTEQYPRRCVFFGTSNKDAYLRDTTGNRRFWPVDTGKLPIRKSVFDDLTEAEVDQIWAEAVHLLRAGEPLYLDRDMSIAAATAQEAHREDDPWEGIIRTYLDEEIPLDWDTWDAERRLAWREGMVADRAQIETHPRDKVCVAEVWCELLGQDKSRIDTRAQRRIGQILSSAPGWERAKSTARFGLYGTQKAWRRKPSM